MYKYRGFRRDPSLAEATKVHAIMTYSILSPRGLHHIKVGFVAAPNNSTPEEDGLHFIKLTSMIIQSRVFWKSILKSTTDSDCNILYIVC